jgi:hypothetical protein
MKDYIAPCYKSDSFNCPVCNRYAHQIWREVHYIGFESKYSNATPDGLMTSTCYGCKEYAIWKDEKMVYPDIVGVESPNSDLNQDIQEDYLEAASILHKSPRGACLLLRLAIEKLCDYFLKTSEPQIKLSEYDLHQKIDLLIAKDLTTERAKRLYRNLHSIKIIGNSAGHPGKFLLEGNKGDADVLFRLINAIADETITNPKIEKGIFDGLPENKTREIKNKIEQHN